MHILCICTESNATSYAGTIQFRFEGLLTHSQRPNGAPLSVNTMLAPYCPPSRGKRNKLLPVIARSPARGNEAIS